MADYINTTNNTLPDPASPGFIDGDTITLQNGSKFSRQSGRWEPVRFQTVGQQSKEVPVTATLSGGGVVIPALGTAIYTPASTVRLRNAAAALGVMIGAAVDETSTGYGTSAPYTALVDAEVDLLTSANSMKDSHTWTSATTWDFSEADAFMSLADTHGKKVRGHVLMYPDHPPSWQTTSTVTSANWAALIDAHMSRAASRYQGLVGLDVVNEMFIISTSAPFAGGYKDSVWLQAAGDGDLFMKACFDAAAKYAPAGTPLFYCDNGSEQGNDSARNAQKNSIVAALTRLKAAGVRIDGFNSQWHVVVDPSYDYRLDRAKHRDFLKSLVDLGLIINITEIDVRMPIGGWSGSSSEFDRRAADLLAATLETYFDAVPAALRQHISFWEMGDQWNAWGGSQRPCPFDTALARKDMYAAALTTFLGA